MFCQCKDCRAGSRWTEWEDVPPRFAQPGDAQLPCPGVWGAAAAVSTLQSETGGPADL